MKIIRGDFSSILVLTIFMFIVGIMTGEPTFFITGFINVLLLIYQYFKRRKKIEKEINERKENELNDENVNIIKNIAKRNIDKKYNGIKLSEEQRKNLIREEFIRLMIERR